MTITFGNVPHPPFVDRLIPDAQNWAWDDIGPRNKWVGIVQHTMVGSLNGTDQFFRLGIRAAGLTDYGIGGATDGPELDGVIYRWNDPTGKAHGTYGTAGYVSPNRAGWANGTIAGLEGDGPAFVKKYGANGVNRFLVSIERSDGGNVATPPSAKYVDSFCALAAYWADQGRIAWDTYPWNAGENLAGYYWHLEFAEKGCPHPAVTSQVNMFQARVKEILRQYQAGEEEDPLADFPKSDVTLNSDEIWPNYGSGKVSQAWKAYGEATGIWNSPGQPWGSDPAQAAKIYCFEGGPCFDEQGKLIVKVK